MHKKSNKVIFKDLQLTDYQVALKQQTSFFEEILAIKAQNRNSDSPKYTPNYLIFCEHPHTFTLGKSGLTQHLLLNPQELQETKATFYQTNRGGDITYHGPGQIIGYPIFDLENFFTDIHKYMRSLEEAVILTLAHFNLKAGRIQGLTGVWLEGENPAKARKICALGVKTSRWVTMHGFAFNVSPNLDYFGYIVPCGISDKAVTSLEKEIGYKPDFEMVKQILKENLAQVFDFEILN
jgi:lipoyl(octanoyl) transferase